MIREYRRRFWFSLALTVPILLLSPMIQSALGLGQALRFSGDTLLLFVLSTIVYLYGGAPFLRGIGVELRAKSPGMMTLVAVAITAAYLYSAAVVLGLQGEIFFWELATLVDIMLLGHWLEMRSVAGASRSLEALAQLLPKSVHRIEPDGTAKDVPLDELKAGDSVIIRPGEKIPADGVIEHGDTTVNESLLTGESRPVYKKTGAKVIGGSTNNEGSIMVVVRRTGGDSFLSQVIELVRQAQSSRSRTQDLASRAAKWLVIVALAAGAATLAAWIAAEHRNIGFALERAVTVMVIACPHALGLAVPLVVAVSTFLASQRGLLIRDRRAFETGRRIQAVIFDKTGTLTEGKFGVDDVLLLGKRFPKEELLDYAASLESRSEHPIARAVAAAGGNHLTVEDFRAIPGTGATGTVNGREVTVAGPGYLRERNLYSRDERLETLAAAGKALVYIIIDGTLEGAIALSDVVRPASKTAIARLKAMGIECMMLTGDSKTVARAVAVELGIDEYFAEVLPGDKAAKVRAVQGRGLVVAMAGDGLNDAPALAQADVGVAMGAGTNIAAETADIILVRNDPMDVVALIGLSRSTYRKMVQNLAWATGYNVIAIPLAAGVLAGYGILLSPALGALLMSLSTVIVAVNAKLLRPA